MVVMSISGLVCASCIFSKEDWLIDVMFTIGVDWGGLESAEMVDALLCVSSLDVFSCSLCHLCLGVSSLSGLVCCLSVLTGVGSGVFGL